MLVHANSMHWHYKHVKNICPGNARFFDARTAPGICESTSGSHNSYNYIPGTALFFSSVVQSRNRRQYFAFKQFK